MYIFCPALSLLHGWDQRGHDRHQRDQPKSSIQMGPREELPRSGIGICHSFKCENRHQRHDDRRRFEMFLAKLSLDQLLPFLRPNLTHLLGLPAQIKCIQRSKQKPSHCHRVCHRQHLCLEQRLQRGICLRRLCRPHRGRVQHLRNQGNCKHHNPLRQAFLHAFFPILHHMRCLLSLLRHHQNSPHRGTSQPPTQANTGWDTTRHTK
mmetsp:Transcript_10622/g.21381  ORF Transcript_10622/g.21381 Transcript_10622/m.21381 type:complete len:207 (-) Transcript_10622:163-783(-)